MMARSSLRWGGCANGFRVGEAVDVVDVRFPTAIDVMMREVLSVPILVKHARAITVAVAALCIEVGGLGEVVHHLR